MPFYFSILVTAPRPLGRGGCQRILNIIVID